MSQKSRDLRIRTGFCTAKSCGACGSLSQAMHDDSENWKQEIKSLKNEIQQQQEKITKQNELEIKSLKTGDINKLLKQYCCFTLKSLLI